MRNKSLLLTITFLIIAISSMAQKTGTFTDSRDKKAYKTVVIGTQTWMAENIAFKTEKGCWAYDNKQSNVTTYGYLYNWETAKTACPSGWHLPTDAEWNVLTDAFGGFDNAGLKLKSDNGWGEGRDEFAGSGNNESKFAALPGGYYWQMKDSFSKAGDYGLWWSSTPETIGSSAKYRCMNNQDDSVEDSFYNIKIGLSVRCIKD